VRESRALAIQPRTIEVLHALGVAEAMIERANPAVRLQMHTPTRTVEAPLFDIGLDDTAYPFLLFLSQAETETILHGHLAANAVAVEHGVELVDLDQHPDLVTCTLRHTADGHTEHVDARYVVGCDGAHSSVRDHARIPFTGAAYPQTFVLADIDAEGLDPGAAHVYLSTAGMLFFFPLGHPAPWRLLGIQPTDQAPTVDRAPQLTDLQRLADPYTAGRIHLCDPVWSTYFRIHHRHAASYQAGRVFLAGDAAHVHSPAGAQGMNTGIQDATNLGWKLALVTSRHAPAALLETYPAERQPIGRNVLRFTDRAATIATSTNPLVAFARTHLAPRLIHLGLRSERGRALAFRSLSQLAVNYRNSPASVQDHPPTRRGPHAGDRLPNAPITIDGQPHQLHDILTTPTYHLLLTGPTSNWPTPDTLLEPRHTPLVDTHHLTRDPRPAALVDIQGHAHTRLGLRQTDQAAHYLIRPDGHIAYRATSTNLTGLRAYLDTWLPNAPPPSPPRKPRHDP
jgi:2-polyprenyl-6-methoxyphenol hydroxylase-like FAD-dependent oxidoreductase